MEKYTKTINELKKEYRKLKLSNTHNKFTNNKLMNRGGILDDIGEAIGDALVGTIASGFDAASEAITTRNHVANTPLDPFNSFTGDGSMFDSVLGNTKEELESDYKEHYIYMDYNEKIISDIIKKNKNVMNCMVYDDTDFI